MMFNRAISLWSLLFAGISSVIGSGWLFGPLFAAQIAGPAAIISWIVGGLLMMTVALTFAELGSAFPVAGGMVHFAQMSHGRLMSFMMGWMVWISSVTVAPVETLGIVQYAANYFPSLVTSIDHTHVLTHQGMGVAAVIMAIMCVLNYYGALFFSRSNNIITSIKLIVPIATAIILIGLNFHAENFTLEKENILPYGWHSVAAALPLGGIIYSYIGSNTVLQLAGETKNPQRNIPLALMGSLLFCMVLYVLLQIAFVGAIDPQLLSNGWHQLRYPGDSGPFTGIIAGMGLMWFVMIVYADAFISPFGTGFVFTASTARVGYGLSEVGFFPALFKKLSARGVPFRMMMLNYVVGLLLFLPFPGWQKLASFIISCFIVSYIVGPISLIVLRQKEPHLNRPFLLPYPKTIAFLAFYICNLLIFWTGWQTVSKMMIALSIGLLCYIFYAKKEKNNLTEWKRSGWLFPYLIVLSVISYFGTFGGGSNVIPFGMDFILVGLLSAIVFCVSLKLSV